MNLPVNSTWRCGCGARQQGGPTTYADALLALREHQTQALCKDRRRVGTDRIHSAAFEPYNELHQPIQRDEAPALCGPPKPAIRRVRRLREGLAWLEPNAPRRRAP